MEDLREKVDSHLEVRTILDRMEGLEERKRKAETQLAELETMALEARTASSRDRAVADLVEGEDPDLSGGPSADEIRDLQEQVSLLDAAVKTLRRQLGEKRKLASMGVAKDLRPTFRKAWGEVVEAAVKLSELAGALDAEYDELRAANILYAGALPVTALGWADARDPYSKINMFISSIVEDWGLDVKRKVMEDAEKAREKARKLEQEEKQRYHGGGKRGKAA